MIHVAPQPTRPSETSTFEDALSEEISLALRSTGYLELFDVEARIDGHNVLLRGRVPSYFLKQKAEFIVRGLPGVAILTSDIDVSRG